MSVPFVDLKAQYQGLKQEIDPAILGVVERTEFILGPSVSAFEESFARFCGARHCIGVNSGTAALTLILHALDIGPGDECIVPVNTFFATAEAVSILGATPVFVDCDERTALMDIAKISGHITPRTKAIIPVHLYGQPVDIDAINKVVGGRNIAVVEDACQAHGALLRGKVVGGFGRAGAFSFYPGKNLGAYGDAGGIVTNDDTLAESMRILRDHGMKPRYHHKRVAWNERMDGIQGAVLNIKLPHLQTWNDQRREHAARYRSLLDGVGVLRFFDECVDRTAIYHLFVIRTEQRDALSQFLQDRGIQTGIHYPIPLHLQGAYSSLGYHKGAYPIAETLAAEILSLPMFPELSEAQQHEVCGAIKDFFAS